MPHHGLMRMLHGGTFRFFKADAPKKMTTMLQANNKVHTHEDRLAWLNAYVTSCEFLESYDAHSLRLVSEATFWSVQLGLDVQFSKMSYQEIREFQPYYTHFKQHTEYTDLINEVFRKLVTPTWSDEAFFAIEKSAWCVYMHHNTFEKLMEETETYDLNASIFRNGY
ncbi:MAG: hypothetical protein P1U36_07975 [Legionellaceae bacterium]|nr:hypothetical protein [Legionellaceae bacterium]